MDIPRKSQARKRLIKRIIYGIIVLGGIAGLSWYLRRLQPAAPSVDRATVWIDTVKRGEMIRQVRGLGTLVPLDIRWIPALTDGRVEQKLILPGAHVKPDTVLLILSNQQLEQETVNAEWDWKAAESVYTDIKVKLDNQQLTQEADVARIQSDYSQATLRAAADENLAKLGLVPELTLKLDKVTAQELGNRLTIEKRRLEANKESIKAQLDVQRVKVEQLKAVYELKKSQFDQLKVRAGITGVLQLLPVDEGQRVTPGFNLARVADPTKLKAELKIAETQAKDVQVGQSASVDTRNGIIPARVIRIDPSVINGTRTVDVALMGELPKGAVPDLSVDGVIELERLDDVVYVGRPVQGQADSMITLFKLEPDGKEAIRVQVKLGKSSVSTIEIREGLKPGDQVILSDMSAQDNFNRIRLN
ncbi:MAG TPA: efflux RND transporter periplasmic adaptor subunit [Acidobacteriota bacterium]|nr:efflux RND transporter periplasmic adaptor subunit [Acidobacteriota bacterium]